MRVRSRIWAFYFSEAKYTGEGSGASAFTVLEVVRMTVGRVGVLTDRQTNRIVFRPSSQQKPVFVFYYVEQIDAPSSSLIPQNDRNRNDLQKFG